MTEHTIPDSTLDTTVTADPQVGPEQHSGERKPRSLWNDAWDDLKHNPLFWVSAVLIVIFVLMAAAPGLFTRTNPRACNLSAARHLPSAVHWFGTDVQGCDVYARTIYAVSYTHLTLPTIYSV